jgi:hypothetical protein
MEYEQETNTVKRAAERYEPGFYAVMKVALLA